MPWVWDVCSSGTDSSSTCDFCRYVNPGCAFRDLQCASIVERTEAQSGGCLGDGAGFGPGLKHAGRVHADDHWQVLSLHVSQRQQWLKESPDLALWRRDGWRHAEDIQREQAEYLLELGPTVGAWCRPHVDTSSIIFLSSHHAFMQYIHTVSQTVLCCQHHLYYMTSMRALQNPVRLCSRMQQWALIS